MPKNLNSNGDPDEPIIYQIRIKGHLHRRWAEWFGGVSVTLQDNGDTLLTGLVVDQAALHGLLKKIRDLGMALISINRITPDETDTQEIKS